MIAKITSGARFAGLARYLHGPGRDEEHVYAGRAGGAVIGGNLAFEGERDGSEWAGLLREAAGTRPEIARPVWHVSLRNPASDRVLSDAEWADAGQGFAQAMGLEEHPWVMVRHGGDHVHLVASRVGFDGRVWSKGNDRYRAQAATAAIEKDLGLAVAPRRSTAASRRPADHQISAGEWRRAIREREAPGRVVLAEAVRAAATAATGRGREGFEVALGRAGVEHQVNVASTGRVSGYRFHLPGHDDGAGEPVWFRASQLDKALAWSRLAPVLDGPVPAPAVKVASRGVLEGRRRHQQRVERAEVAERMAAVPGAVHGGVSSAHRWWCEQATGRAEEIAARTLARAREAAERRAIATVIATSYPIGPKRAVTAADLSAKQAGRGAARSYTPPTRGPSQGR